MGTSEVLGRSPRLSPSPTYISRARQPVGLALALGLERLSGQPPCAVLSSASVRQKLDSPPQGGKAERNVQVPLLNKEGQRDWNPGFSDQGPSCAGSRPRASCVTHSSA